MKYSLVLMDLDDTIFDFNDAQHHAFIRTMEFFGFSSDAESEKKFKDANHYVWNQFENNSYSKNEALQKRFQILLGDCDAKQINKIYLEHLASPPKLLSGALELISHILDYTKLAFVTNGDSKTQRLRMKRSEISHLQSSVTISDDVGVGKPHPDIFRHAVQKAGCTIDEDILMVGDNLKADIKGADNLGFDTIWMNANNSSCDIDVTPTHICTNLHHVLQCLL